MNRAQIRMVRESYEYFRPCGAAMVARVFRNLGDHHPGLRALLPERASALHEAWFRTLGQVVEHADTFGKLESPLGALGRRAFAAGANSGHYRVVRSEVLDVMSEYAGDEWTEELRRAWALLLDAMTGAMLAGAVDRGAAA